MGTVWSITLRNASLVLPFLFTKGCCCLVCLSLSPMPSCCSVSADSVDAVPVALTPKPKVSQDLTLSHISRGNFRTWPHVIDCRWNTGVYGASVGFLCRPVLSAGYCSVCSEIWATLEYFLLKLHVPLYCGSFCLFLPLISSLSSSSYTQLLAAFLRHCFHHCPPTSTVVNLSV